MLKHLSDSLTETVDLFVERKVQTGGKGVDYIGIPTGFPKLDKLTGGWRKNNLYVVAGRTGMGKSSWGLTAALNNAKMGKPALYITLEMSIDILVTRLLSGMTQISTQDLEYGRFNDEQYVQIIQAQQELINIPFFVVDDVINSPTAIALAKEVDKLEIMYVDHASLLNDATPSSGSEVDRVSQIVRTLRHGATEMNIPVIALAQLNRQAEFREPPRPILSDLKQSGTYEEDASVVIFLYRPAYYLSMKGGAPDTAVETDAEVIIAKNRFGPTGKIVSNFHTTQMKWSE